MCMCMGFEEYEAGALQLLSKLEVDRLHAQALCFTHDKKIARARTLTHEKKR